MPFKAFVIVILFEMFSNDLCIYGMMFSLVEEEKKSLDRVLTTSCPPTEGTCNCKLCQWKTIYRYINFFNDKRPQHPRCEHSFPDQIRGMDTMPETFHSRCNWRHPLVLGPFLRRSEHSSRLSRTYNISILYDNV